MIDSWHFRFSDNTWDDLAAVPLDDIAYLQFTDALEPDLVSALIREKPAPSRSCLAKAFSSWHRFAATLLERGYDGIVSVEVLSARSCHGDAARRTCYVARVCTSDDSSVLDRGRSVDRRERARLYGNHRRVAYKHGRSR